MDNLERVRDYLLGSLTPDNICKTRDNLAVSSTMEEDPRKGQDQQRGSRAHIPLGWIRISTGLSKVCLLASVITMLLAERAEGSASARISCVGLSTPAHGNQGMVRELRTGKTRERRQQGKLAEDRNQVDYTMPLPYQPPHVNASTVLVNPPRHS